MVFGGVTLVWGGIVALRQTDLKQMLAQSTIASLGLLVLLIGVGTEGALIAGAPSISSPMPSIRPALFLVAGAIDHETGTRDITVLGGLRDKMAVTFIGAILAALSMFGLPPALGYLAKEEMYAAGVGDQSAAIVTLAAMVARQCACSGAVALAVVDAAVPRRRSCRRPRSRTRRRSACWSGRWLFGLCGTRRPALRPPGSATASSVPMAVGDRPAMPVELHLGLDIDPRARCSGSRLATWALGDRGLSGGSTRIRTVLRRLQSSVDWSFDTGFDSA